MVVLVKESYINLYERNSYKDKKDLEKAENLLLKSMHVCKNKFQKAMYIPLGIHLMKERQRLIGLTTWERVQLKAMKVQRKAFNKLLKRWGVPID